MRLAQVCLLTLALLLGGQRPAEAAPVVIKLATLVPDGSVWDKALRSMGSQWKRDTGDRVQLRVYPGGVAGDEPDVLRKMRIGQLNAATLTVRGLIEIDPAFEVLAIPLFYDSYDEFFHVLRALDGEMRELARERGFELIQWGHAGWVHMFSTEPARTVADLRRLKLFVSAGDDDTVQWWKDRSFRPVALAMTDIMTGLQTGMIETLPTTPLAALSLQWFRRTPYMLDVGLAPLVGATIVSSRTWNRLSPEDREVMLRVALSMEQNLEREIPEQDGTAIAEMSKRGLTVLSADDAPVWRAEAGRFAESMRGERVPAAVFDRAKSERDAYRRQQGSGDSR